MGRSKESHYKAASDTALDSRRVRIDFERQPRSMILVARSKMRDR